MPYTTQQAAGPHAIFKRGWWYRDYDDYLDTITEYREDERERQDDAE